MQARYAKNNSSVFSLTYHIVWCSKYRRGVLVGEIEQRLRELILEVSDRLGTTVHALEIMPDHVHLFIEGDPTRSVAEIVNRIKGLTSNRMRKEFSTLRTRIPTLWSRSYYAGTAGQVSAAVIERYIAGQKGK